MTAFDVVVLVAAGLAAGIANAVAGGGSLLSFPALLAAGYPAVTANVTNTIALWPGYLSGVVAYRRELAEQRHRVKELAVVGAIGGAVGTVLLLQISPGVFKAIVPYLVLLAVVLLGLQPRIAALVQRRRAAAHVAEGPEHHAAALRVAVLLAAVYGAYFGGALGVILVAVLGIFITDTAQHINGLKNALSFTINSVALVGFALFGPVAWEAVAIVGPASLVGGAVGGRLARRLSATALRRAVIIYGSLAAIRLFFG
jgi:uncharacterized membrane protein YfcA